MKTVDLYLSFFLNELKMVSLVGLLMPYSNILKDIDMVSSTSEALRLINQGAVKIDQKKIKSKDYDFGLDEKN